jgi:hypothetical protein
MPVGDQDGSGVAMTPPVSLGGLDEPIDFLLGQILTHATNCYNSTDEATSSCCCHRPDAGKFVGGAPNLLTNSFARALPTLGSIVTNCLPIACACV